MKVIWNSHFSVHNWSVAGTQPLSFLACCLWLLPCYKCKNGVVATKTLCPQSLKYLLCGSSQKKSANLCFSAWDLFFLISHISFYAMWAKFQLLLWPSENPTSPKRSVTEGRVSWADHPALESTPSFSVLSTYCDPGQYHSRVNTMDIIFTLGDSQLSMFLTTVRSYWSTDWGLNVVWGVGWD